MLRYIVSAYIALAFWGCNYDIQKQPRDQRGFSESEPPLDGEEDIRLSYQYISENILRDSCLGCHQSPRNRGGVNLETYENVFSNRHDIEEAVDTFYMPDSVGGHLADDKRALLLKWLEIGAPRKAPNLALEDSVALTEFLNSVAEKEVSR